jgi:hypothetical protein
MRTGSELFMLLIAGEEFSKARKLHVIRAQPNPRRHHMNLIFLIVLIVVLLAILPTWPYSSGWGYGPSSGLGLVVLILVILMLMGKI